MDGLACAGGVLEGVHQAACVMGAVLRESECFEGIASRGVALRGLHWRGRIDGCALQGIHSRAACRGVHQSKCRRGGGRQARGRGAVHQGLQ